MQWSRFDLTVWGVLSALGAGLLIALLMGDQVGARITRVFPAEGSEVGAYNRIGVEFAQPMQLRSVESLLRIEPAVSGEFLWDGPQMWLAPDKPLIPGQSYVVRLTPGAAAQNGQTTKRELMWRFTVRTPALIYMSPSDGRAELWRKSGDKVEPLTNTGGKVYDYAVSRDGAQIVYSVHNAEQGIDLWSMNGDGKQQRLLLPCQRDRCFAPVIAPNGQQIAYNRARAGVTPGAPYSLPRIWLFKPAAGRTAPLYQDSQVLGSQARWSPDGRRIAFFDSAASGIRVWDFLMENNALFPTQIGEGAWSWSGDSTRIVYNDLVVTGSRLRTQVHVADVTTKNITSTLGNQFNQLSYNTPAWSPSGEWIVLNSKLDVIYPGDQLWLVRSDGSEARPITKEQGYIYNNYTWDPSGQALAFERISLNVANARMELVVWTLATGSAQVMASDAIAPDWQP